MNILQKPLFQKSYKKLHKNQKQDVDDAIKTIIENPSLGQSKTGDISNVFVYKFKMVKQFTLLAYTYESQTITLTLLALGTRPIHENFYRDLKKPPPKDWYG